MRDHTLASAARDVAAAAAQCAEEAESNRRLDPEVVKGLVAAGFMRHFVPVEHGGEAGSFAELLPAVMTLGEVCTATAWCASVLAASSRIASFFPAEARAAVWAGGPDTVVVASVTPFGSAEAVPGGWRVSGRWPYISGVDYADWAVVCAKVDGERAPEVRVFALPRGDFAVEDTWFSTGMRATGSNTVVVEGHFVASSFSLDRAALLTGRADGLPPAAPLPAVNGLSFVIPALGAAQGALDAFSGYIASKVRNAPALPGVPGAQGNLVTYQTVLARSAGEIDAARLLLERAAAAADQVAEITPRLTMRNQRDCALAADWLVTAVNRIFRTAGTSGQAANSVLQRLWRDVNSVSTHMALQFEPVARGYTASLFD